MKKINNCSYLKSLNNVVIKDIENNSYFNDIKLNISNNTIIYDYQNDFYCYENGQLFKINSNNGELVPVFKYEDSTYINPIKNYYLIYNRVSRKEKYFHIVDSQKNILWTEKEKMNYKIIDDNLYSVDDSICQFNIEDGSQIWHYELLEGYRIHNSIQLVENVLFFEAYKGTNDYNKVLGIDVKTGKVLWEYSFQVPYEEEIIAFTVNSKNNLSYGYLENLYQVFNPVTGEMVLEKDMSSYYEQGISPNKNAIYDNRLWFVSGKGENVKFGAINLETSEIEFVQDFPLNTAEQNDEHFDTPVFHNGKLYLIGVHYNTLYIFEKEEYKSREK